MHEFDKCLIFSIPGTKLAEGFVREYENDTMRIVIQGEYSLRLSIDVNLYVYNEVRGECLYTGTVAKFDGSGVIISGLSFKHSTQKRDNARVSKVLHYHISAKFSGNEKIKFDKPVEMTILNISAQGIYMTCGYKFILGERFSFIFRELGKPIELTAEVVRAENFTRSSNYGCRFVDISQKDMDNIFRFVLHEQIEQRRRSLIL